MPVLVPPVLRTRLQGAVDVIAQDLAAIAEAPYARLQWADRLFAVAARHHVVRSVIAALEAETNETPTARYDRITAFCRNETVQKARHASPSTSSSANLLERCELAEWAAVTGILGGYDHA